VQFFVRSYSIGMLMKATRKAVPSRLDRKADILLAAEKLFAQNGYHAVSIRDIAQEAGVPLALVGYHYGPKQELFHAIFAHWNSTIKERLQELKTVIASPKDTRTLPRIIDAFVGPVMRMRASAEGEYYALLVARGLFQGQEESDRVLREFFDPLAHDFIDALHAALPHATRAQIAWGYQFALGALLHHISDTRIARLSKGQNTPNDPDAALLLTRFIVGGLQAALPTLPVSKKTKAPISKRSVKTKERDLS
jgi:AcrR family transcriptional regulator